MDKPWAPAYSRSPSQPSPMNMGQLTPNVHLTGPLQQGTKSGQATALFRDSGQGQSQNSDSNSEKRKAPGLGPRFKEKAE